MEASADQTVIQAADGHEIHMRSHAPAGACEGVIQVLHGMGEHGARYDRFARAACERDFAVVVHDHRGHGERADLLGHFADTNGWKLVVGDCLAVLAAVRERFPGKPVVLLGHSMGSFLAQHVAMHASEQLAGLILSASTRPRRAELLPALVVTRLAMLRHGQRGKSPLLHRLGFDGFNRRFEPARTPNDWLSRDEAEVDRYAADPLCGGPYSCAMWRDLLGGLWSLAADSALEPIRSELPILITGGSVDPVGGQNAMERLAAAYRKSGHQHVDLCIYDGGRHEMLNETNRDAVTRDWLDWIDATSRSSRAD